MGRFKTKDVILRFCLELPGQSYAVYSSGTTLIHWRTALGQHLSNGDVVVNNSHYSVTSSKHKNTLLRTLISNKIKYILTTKDVPEGTTDLIKYI